MQRFTTTFLLITVSAFLLSACGGSSTDNSTATTRMTLNVTDAPVDNAEAVVVEFTSVTLKPDNGDDIVFVFADNSDTVDIDESKQSIDLLALQGSVSQPLIENVEIPAGGYNQIRLGVNAEFDGVMDSYITIDGVQHELRVPSGSQSGLKLNTPFTLARGTEGVTVADNNSVFTIDFDLRKSITNPVGLPGYFLKPSLRLVQNVSTGHISGTVDENLLNAESCSGEGNAVYVFAGENIVADDIDGIDAEPLTSALIVQDADTMVYSYEVGFLLEGHYTLAVTCMADLDEDEEDNSDVVVFDSGTNVEVIAGENTEAPLLAPSQS